MKESKTYKEMKSGEKIENLGSTRMEDPACGGKGADGRQIEFSHDCSKDSRRQEIEAFDAAISVRHILSVQFQIKFLQL